MPHPFNAASLNVLNVFSEFKSIGGKQPERASPVNKL